MNAFDDAAKILGADVVAQIRADVRAELAANPYTQAELERFAPLLNRLRDSAAQAAPVSSDAA